MSPYDRQRSGLEASIACWTYPDLEVINSRNRLVKNRRIWKEVTRINPMSSNKVINLLLAEFGGIGIVASAPPMLSQRTRWDRSTTGNANQDFQGSVYDQVYFL